MSFDTLGLKPGLLQAVSDSGYTIPTPIQIQAIPAILTGKDVMAAAQTGTGKTAGFTLPLLQMLADKPPVAHNHVRALILTPTRELAAQIQESIETYGKHEKLRSVVIFGGVNINPQMQALRKGCDILVATPGRLMDLYQQNAVKFSALEVLILDEADRMLDMGFIRDIRKILALLPKKRQNLMFSATFSDEIRTLTKTICHQPLEIDVAPRNSTVDKITQHMYLANKDHKLPLLAKLLKDTPDQVLVFSRTKHGANNLVKKLAQYDLRAAAIHGNKSQAQRTKALAEFKNNQVQVLIATDIAARGIDIDQLAMVVNFDLPQVAEDYVHRIGRTGRAGASGIAVSLVSDEEIGQLRAIERLIKRKIERAECDPATFPVRNANAVEIIDDDRPRRDSRQPRQQGRRQGQSQQAQPKQAQSRDRQPRQGSQSSPARSTQGQAAQPRQGQTAQARPRQGSGGQASSSARSHNHNGNTGNANGNRSNGNGNSDSPQQRSAGSSQGKARQPGRDNGNVAHSRHAASGVSQPADNSGFWQKLRNSLPRL